MSKKKKNNIVPIVLVAAIAVAAFLGGRISAKLSTPLFKGKEGEGKIVTYSPTKQEVPNAKFFVMSFCPFGNQAEAGLKPVADLLKDTNIEWEPRYIVNKMVVADLKTRCEEQVYTVARCKEYVGKNYFPDEASCKEKLYATNEECVADQALIIGTDAYTSLHGVTELNQNVREICVWKDLGEDKSMWWDFIERTNGNCTAENVEECWEEQAESSGLEVAKIKSCFEVQAQEILDEEIAVATEYQAGGSPTFIFNGEQFPPAGSYPTAEGEIVSLKIGKEVFTPEQYRSPNVLKAAICAGWEKEPKECKTKLEETGTTSSGGC